MDALEWNSIIEPLESKVNALKKMPRSKKKIANQKYFSEIIQHLYFCKDAWRNHVSHSQVPYDMPQAKSVMDHTALVMALISKRMKTVT